MIAEKGKFTGEFAGKRKFIENHPKYQSIEVFQLYKT